MTRLYTPDQIRANVKAAVIVSTTGWGDVYTTTEVPRVFFCPPCWRKYFAGTLTREQVERTMYRAVKVGRIWKCPQCLLEVESFLLMDGEGITALTVPVTGQTRPKETVEHFLGRCEELT